MSRHKGHGVSKLALFAAAAPSLIKRPNFPYGAEKEAIIKVVPFELGEVQNQSIKNSKLTPFKYSGHGSFYDQLDKFNEELMKFIEE